MRDRPGRNLSALEMSKMRTSIQSDTPAANRRQDCYSVSATTGLCGASESVLFCEVVKMLPIHSHLTCRGTQVPVVTR